MLYENYYTQFMMMPEYCAQHPFMIVEIYGSCESKLCYNCLHDHYHENICFQPIKEKVSKFHSDVNLTLKFITEQLSRLRHFSHGTCDRDLKTKVTTLLSSLNELSSKIKHIISTKYFVTYDILLEFKKGNFLEKAMEMVMSFYKKQTIKTRPIIDDFIKKKFNTIPSHGRKDEEDKEESSRESSPRHYHETSLSISNIKPSREMKLISASIFNSNRENIDPFTERFDFTEENKEDLSLVNESSEKMKESVNRFNIDIHIEKMKSPEKIAKIEKIEVAALFEKSAEKEEKEEKEKNEIKEIKQQEQEKEKEEEKEVAEKISESENDHLTSLTETCEKFEKQQSPLLPIKICGNELNLNKIPCFKPKNTKSKINSTFFRSEPLLANFNYECQTAFLDSTPTQIQTGAEEMSKIVCVSCRDKFIVPKVNAKWRMRCDVCTQNYN